MPRTRSAITLTDIIVMLVILALLAVITVPAMYQTRESAFRVKCGTNLRNIGHAILLYSNANRGSYPRTVFQEGAAPTCYTGAPAKDPFGPGGPAPNDVTAALYLLVRVQGLSPETLVCPTTEALMEMKLNGQPSTSFSNIPAPVNLGYSIANPYANQAARNTGFRWNSTLGAEFAVAADMNPGGLALTRLTVNSSPDEMRQGNSLNEGRRGGQSVLYGDGHVEFQQNPFCGQKRDNIYTVSGSTDGSSLTSNVIVGSPTWAGDCVLLPVAQLDPKGQLTPREREQQTTLWTIGIAATLIILVITWRIFCAKKKRRLTSAS